MSEFDQWVSNRPRLCRIKIVVIGNERVLDRRDVFALCKGKEDRDLLISQLRAEKTDWDYGTKVEIFADYKWEPLTMTNVRFQAVEGQILMWTIRCNGKVMGRMKTLKSSVRHMERMINSLGKPNDKWSIRQE